MIKDPWPLILAYDFVRPKVSLESGTASKCNRLFVGLLSTFTDNFIQVGS